MFKHKKKTPTESEISTEKFYQYFKSLSNQDPPFVNMKADNLLHNLDTYRTGSTIQELGSPITQEEIKNASKQLNSNRACSLDTILNEYLKESVDLLLAPLETLFNYKFSKTIDERGDFTDLQKRRFKSTK